MVLKDEALDICDEHGGLWELVKTPEFRFYDRNCDALDEIYRVLREYRFCKRLLKERLLGVDGNPPLRTKEDVKVMLKEKKIKVPKNATEYQLRKLLYNENKAKLKKDFEFEFRYC